ncbi:hypothetical protein HPB49_012793 [Dermacentor silvarum]|uniref:Uncharacterized protein n=1 Tax=Dermacentor silvarum TaxID=543639 RepID=A0ACB8E0C2_DERSI|nr:hypothetical protein HPB49_012793 [Dermacentor silvarum]
MGAITQLDAGIEAEKADAIEEELLIVNNLMMTIDSVTERSFFKRAFRVTPAKFRYTVDTLRPLLERQNTNMREAIALDKRVAIGLYRLCSSAEDRSVAELFAVGGSTVNAEWTNMPTASSMAEHIREFTATLEFPQAMGSLDGCHFPVDHKYRFRYINVGSPCRCHYAYVYHRSRLADAVKGPLIVENAIGRLKARFRFIFKKDMECDIGNARLVIRACCALNNVCEDLGDTVLQHWLVEVHNNDGGRHQPNHCTDAEEGTGCDVRAALFKHFQQS